MSYYHGIPGTRIVAYTYDADTHCVACTEGRVDVDPDYSVDERGDLQGTDSEGNDVHPVFVTDLDGRSVETCADCGRTICLMCGDTVSDRETCAECSNCRTEWLDEIEQD